MKTNVKLKTLGTCLAMSTQSEHDLDEYSASKVMLEALDTIAYKYQCQHNDIEYDHFKAKVLSEMDRIRGIIASSQPF